MYLQQWYGVYLVLLGIRRRIEQQQVPGDLQPHCTDCLLQQQSGILVQIEFQKSLLDSAYLSLARLLLSSARQLSSISHHEMITIIILCGRLLACYYLDGQILEHS